MAFPLPDARPTSICHDRCPYLAEKSNHSIPFGSSPDLFTSGINNKRRSNGHVLLQCLTGNRSSTTEILIGWIGTRPDKPYFHFTGITVQQYFFCKFRNGSSRIRSERPIDIRFQFWKIYFNNTVIKFLGQRHHFIVSTKIGSYGLRQQGNFFTTGSTQINAHTFIIGKKRSSSPYFGTHITNRSFSGCWNRFRTGTEIFNNGVSATLHSQDTGQFKNNIFGSCPTVKFSGQPDTNQFGHLQFPFHTRHHIYRIGTSYPNSNHSQTTGIRCMRICSYHHSSGKCIIF